MSTKITEDNITSGSITANSFVEGISLGGADESVTIDQIIVADSNFANTEETQIPTTGGYVKLYGNNYTTNSNVYFSNTFALTSQATANVVSNNEIRVTIGVNSVDTYNLFVFNEVGSFAFKESAIITYIAGPNSMWVGGGTGLSTVQRITFSADTSTASIRGPLTAALRSRGAVGNDNYGWFAGGIPGYSTKIDRITFADDTGTASVRSPLNQDRGYPAAVDDSSTYGWIAGGDRTNVERITFSNDTNTPLVRNILRRSRRNFAGIDNNIYGWLAGGFGPTSFNDSFIERITFANDTSEASERGSLSAGRRSVAGTGNDTYGWFGGGYYTSRVDRITFSSDLTTTSVRGPLSGGRFYSAASGNDNYGWFAGGYLSGSATLSSVDRINFADDTVTAAVRGPLSAAAYGPDATAGIA